MSSIAPDDLSVQLGVAPAQLTAVLAAAAAALPAQPFYVYRIAPGAASGANAPSRPRTVPAFRSPDDALAFAQRRSGGQQVRVRAMAAEELLRTMLATPTIGQVIFAAPLAEEPLAGLPPGLAVTRERLLRELSGAPERPTTL